MLFNEGVQMSMGMGLTVIINRGCQISVELVVIVFCPVVLLLEVVLDVNACRL